MPEPTVLDLDLVRSRFPSLDSEWVFFDNGGGSQILASVLGRMNDYLIRWNVQLGASYAPSREAAARLAEAHEGVATLMNAADPDEIVMGPSSTALLATLANSIGETLGPGDEIIVTTGDHEANVSPWLRLESKGVVLRFWNVEAATGELRLEDLDALLGDRTRLVAVTHTSNILGTINPVREIADRVHARGALLVVDGVGFAPHRAVDVQALGADFYAFSFYKVFGPHHAVLWGRKELLVGLPGQSLGFISEDDVPYKFQPGNVNYELSYATLGLLDHLTMLGGGGEAQYPVTGGSRATRQRLPARAAVEAAFEEIAIHEESLARRLLDFLAGRPGVRIIGSPSHERSIRVPIISFVSDRRRSSDVVRHVDHSRIGIRFGHFYSRRLIEAIELPEDDGVVRVSMVHYNTVEEVDRLTESLSAIV